ncbi:MAG TPA: hypothetical protein VMZ24_07520 [Patescibacteria group bacterium]|jgi:hypothetical protein|nr:hypothetical protein [Patescibacteria group bacterium]
MILDFRADVHQAVISGEKYEAKIAIALQGQKEFDVIGKKGTEEDNRGRYKTQIGQIGDSFRTLNPRSLTQDI